MSLKSPAFSKKIGYRRLASYLVPAFLEKLDHRLLINHPHLWKTRIHYFVFYSFMVTNILLILAGMLYPMSPENLETIPKSDSLGTFWNILTPAVIIMGLVMLVWRRKESPAYKLKPNLVMIACYIFCFATLAINIFVFPVILHYRVIDMFDANSDYQYVRTQDEIFKNICLKSGAEYEAYIDSVKAALPQYEKRINKYVTWRNYRSRLLGELSLMDSLITPDERKNYVNKLIDDLKNNQKWEDDFKITLHEYLNTILSQNTSYFLWVWNRPIGELRGVLDDIPLESWPLEMDPATIKNLNFRFLMLNDVLYSRYRDLLFQKPDLLKPHYLLKAHEKELNGLAGFFIFIVWCIFPLGLLKFFLSNYTDRAWIFLLILFGYLTYILIAGSNPRGALFLANWTMLIGPFTLLLIWVVKKKATRLPPTIKSGLLIISIVLTMQIYFVIPTTILRDTKPGEMSISILMLLHIGNTLLCLLVVMVIIAALNRIMLIPTSK